MNWDRIITCLNKEGQQVGTIEANTSGQVALFKINGRIWSWSSEDDSALTTAIQSAQSKGIEKAKVYLNSGGGSVFAATEITNLLMKFKDVKIEVGALMASAATYFTSKFHTTIKANTQGMIHKPKISIQGNEDEVENGLKLLRNIKKDYIDTYIAKTGMSKEALNGLLNKGDYWMDANELLEKKFVDAIKGNLTSFSDNDVLELTACGAPVVPKKNKPNRLHTMNEELIAALGLEASAEQTQVLDAIKALKVDALKYKASQEQEKQKQAQALSEKVEALVNGAIASKKILANQKEQYVQLATADFKNTQTILEAMQPIAKLSNHINTGGTGIQSHDKWTLEDYLEKDPEAYEKLLAEAPEKAAELEAAYHKS